MSRLTATLSHFSALITSASLNDSQAAIPLAALTAQKITSCYDLMDAGYDVDAFADGWLDNWF